MALGGGTFTAQNKTLPGAYVNFISASSASTQLSDRGIATMPLELDWGAEGEVFTVSGDDFRKYSKKAFGYDYAHPKMKGLRDLFLNIHMLHAFRLNTGGLKASNEYAEARCSGVRGNDIKIIIQKSADDEKLFNVKTLMDSIVVDNQLAERSSDLLANDYVVFKPGATLTETVAAPLEGGSNGTVDGAAYQSYLDKIESYTYNAMGIETTDETVKKLFVSFNKRMRDDMGIKFQLVIYDYAADYLGTISVKNKTTDSLSSPASLVYWVTGVIAGCAVNKSCQNMVYNGEFSVDTAYTQTDLAKAIKSGEFILHKVNSDIRVLADINSMVTTTDNCGEVFKENQTIRVIDQLANDDAVLFNTKYLGVVPNDNAGRISLWSDLVKIRQTLQDMRAIENFADSDVTVTAGTVKKSVIIEGNIMVVNAMSQLYMTTTVA